MKVFVGFGGRAVHTGLGRSLQALEEDLYTQDQDSCTHRNNEFVPENDHEESTPFYFFLNNLTDNKICMYLNLR